MNLNQSLNDSLRYMQNGEVDHAEKKLKKILGQHPNNPDALSLLGIILIHQKKFKKGKDLIKSSLLIMPNQPQAILNLGLAFYQENNFDEANKYFEEAIKLQSNYAEAYYCKGLSFQKKNELEKAIKNFSDAYNLNPNYFDPIFNLGSLYFNLGDYENAVIAYQKALSISQNNIDALNMLGYSFNELKRYEDAIDSFKKSLQIKPIQEDTLVGIAYAFMSISELDQAISIYSYVLDINPKNILALNNRANSFLLKQNYRGAIKDLDFLIGIKSDFPNAYATYGNVLTKLEKFDEALEKFGVALNLDENYSEAFQNRGMMFFLQKKYANAIEDFSEAIKIKSDYFDAYNGRGASYKGLKKFDFAMQDFNSANALNPNDPELLSNIAQLYEELGQQDKSLEMHKKAIKYGEVNSIVNYNFSLFLLNLKFFSEGWIRHQYRSYLDGTRKSLLAHRLELEGRFKVWSNRAEKGTLVILSEQGIGDQIIFLSLLSEISIIDNKIIVFISNKLLSLFKRSFPLIEFIGADDMHSKEEWIFRLDSIGFDYFIFMGDLGMIFRNSLADFKNQPKSFLEPDPLKNKSINLFLDKENKKICGLSWKSKSTSSGAEKSIYLKDLINVLEIRELTFINLQYGEVEEEVKSIANEINVNINLVNNVDKFNNIDELASLIDACDYIVTTSNVTAHIAGGLGKNVYLLVPFASGKLWYWHENDDQSIWYPSVKIFRQNKDGSWNNAITSVAKELKGIVNE